MTLTTLQLSNAAVAYRSHGTGEPLALIHGVGMQSAAWGPQIEHFAQNYHVIALDMPGHGGSDPLPVGSQLADYVDWCAAVIAKLDLGPVNLAGHSMGALIASGIAASRPDSVHRVALLNGVYLRDPVAKTAVQDRAAVIRDGQIDLKTPLKRWFDGGQKQAHDQVADWLGSVDLTGYATAYSAFACGDAVYADRFQNITCPFLAITGDDDPNSTPAMSQAMAAAVQNGRSITINGHRHMINLTAADQVNAHLQTWLDQPITATARGS